MSGGILRFPWTSQPQTPVGIDWSNPLSRGLAFVAIGGQPIDLVNNKRGVYVGTAGVGFGPKGRAFTTVNGAANRIDFVNGSPANTIGEYSFGSIFKADSDTGALQYLINRDAFSNLLTLRTAGLTVQQTWNATGLFQSTNVVVAGKWNIASSSSPPSGSSTALDAKLWLNGVKEAAGNATDGALGTKPLGDTILHGRTSDNLRQLNGGQALAVSWNRVLTDAEHASFQANPWQLFAPLSRTIWVPAAAGGGAYTPSITEAITLADTASQVASLSASITEAATLSHSQDAIVGYAVSNTETLNLSHSQTNVANFPATITEAMTLTDSGTAQFGATSTISEAMTLADSSSNVAALSASITESMTLADSPNASASGDYTATQTEAMSLADTASNVAALSASITEAVSLADSSSNVAALSRSISEALTLADTASSSAAGDYTATITEAVTLSDSSSNIATLSATITESAALADTSTASSPGNFAASISESLALAEIASNQAALSAALVEALSLSDNAASAWSRVVALTEAMTLNDAASQTLNAIVTESAWWAYSVEPADLHYSVPAQDLTMSVEPQDLTFSIATLALAGR